MKTPKLAKYGPLPRPASLQEAVKVLKQERFPAPPHIDFITMQATEFTSICPRTGQPDFGQVEITYWPNSWAIESKSWKFFLWSFREEGAFCESLSSMIACYVFDAIQPKRVEVTVKQNARGAIAITSFAARERIPRPRSFKQTPKS